MLPKHLSPDFYNTRRIKLPEEGIDPDPILTVSGVILGEPRIRTLQVSLGMTSRFDRDRYSSCQSSLAAEIIFNPKNLDGY